MIKTFNYEDMMWWLKLNHIYYKDNKYANAYMSESNVSNKVKVNN